MYVLENLRETPENLLKTNTLPSKVFTKIEQLCKSSSISQCKIYLYKSIIGALSTNPDVHDIYNVKISV